MDRNNVSLDRLALFLCVLFSLVLAWMFHDRLSWGPDDGFYAYMAERMAAGDVIHQDLQVLHPGLLYFWHEFIFKLSGEGFVSLRWPLIAITVLQTALAYIITRPYGVFISIAAALALSAFSFVQFVNATPNWYLVFFAILIGYVIDRVDLKITRNLILIGFLVGVAFLLRQLTGVFLALGVTTILFLKLSEKNTHQKFRTGSVILSMLGLAILIYLVKSSELLGFFFFSVWPPVILFCAAKRCNLNLQRAAQIISKLVIGSTMAAIPIALYHIWTGTFDRLMIETFIEPFTYHGLDFISDTSYLIFPLAPLHQLVNGNPWAIFGFLNWSILLSLNLILAVFVIRKILNNHYELSAIAILAVFHGLVAVILEIPLYLNYVIGPVLLGLLIMASSTSERKKLAILSITLSVVAVVFSAGQPIERGRLATLILEKTDGASRQIAGTKLFASKGKADIYDQLTALIQSCSDPEDTIYAYPSNPEVYALSKRKSAFRFTGSYLSLTKPADVDEAAALIKSDTGPVLIIHNVIDVYNTELADDLFDKVSADYLFLAKILRFEIFIRQDRHADFPSCHAAMNR